MILVIERNALHIRDFTAVDPTFGSRPARVRVNGLPLMMEQEPVLASHLGRQDESTDGGLTVSTVVPISFQQLAQQDERARLLAALALRGEPPEPPVGGWRATIGMFADDPLMERIFDSGRRIRESERHD